MLTCILSHHHRQELCCHTAVDIPHVCIHTFTQPFIGVVFEGFHRVSILANPKRLKKEPPPRGFVLGVLEGVERYEQPNNLSEELRLQQFELDSPPNFHIDVDIPQECIHSATATPQAHCPCFIAPRSGSSKAHSTKCVQ